MYYLRTKSAVDAIKFTLDTVKKEEPMVSEGNTLIQTAPVIVQERIASTKTKSPDAPLMDVEPLTAEEMRVLIAQAKAAEEDDDCMMCGS